MGAWLVASLSLPPLVSGTIARFAKALAQHETIQQIAEHDRAEKHRV
jgi:hypothetical protein